MANSREAILTLDMSRVSGGPHDFVCAIGRGDLPDEMFDPVGMNRGYGPDARFYDQNGAELARDYISRSFALDKHSGAGDGYAEYWVRLPQVSSSSEDFSITVQYGDPDLQDYPVGADFGRYAAWVDAEFAIAGSTHQDRSGNSIWGFVGFPAVVKGGPFGSFRSFESNDRFLSSSPNIGARLRTANWCLTSVSLRERYGFSPAIAHFSGTQSVKLYPLDSVAGSGARLTWGNQISGTQLAVSKTGQARLWQWVDVSATSSSQRLRLNGGQVGDVENIFIADPGDFSGGQWAIGGGADFDEDFSGSVAALILWKSSKSDSWILSNYQLAQPGAWSVGVPGPAGGEPVVYEEHLSLGFAAHMTAQRQLSLRHDLALSIFSGTELGSIFEFNLELGLSLDAGLVFSEKTSIEEQLGLGTQVQISPSSTLKLTESLIQNLEFGFEAQNRFLWRENVSLGLAASLGQGNQKLVADELELAVQSGVQLDGDVALQGELVVVLEHRLGIVASFISHLDGLAPPDVLGLGPRHFTFIEQPATGVFSGVPRTDMVAPVLRELQPLADVADEFLQHRQRRLVPESDFRKTRSGE